MLEKMELKKGAKEKVEIMKIIGISLIALVIIILMKQYKPEFAIYISLLTGVLILLLVMDELQGIISLLQALANKASLNSTFLLLVFAKILVKGQLLVRLK